MAVKPLVLLTGATGFIGLPTLLALLRTDAYNIRCVVRSEDKASCIRNHPSVVACKPSTETLSFSLVSDFTASGAFTAAVNGVAYILHIASPSGLVQGDDMKAVYMDPAKIGTLNLLEAAATEQKIKRVVIMSSFVAIIPFRLLFAERSPPGTVFKPTDRITSDWPTDNPLAAYCTSKVEALNATESWITSHKPSFDVVHIHPPFVYGRDEWANTAQDIRPGSSNWSLLLEVIPDTHRFGMPMAGWSVDLSDVVAMTIGSLDTTAVPPTSYGCGAPLVWADANDIIAESFPEAVKKRIISLDATRQTLPIEYDVANAEKVFGLRDGFKTFEEQVKGLVGQYVELAEKGSKT